MTLPIRPKKASSLVSAVASCAPTATWQMASEWKVLMRRNRGVRSRVLAVLALPVLALMVAAGVFSAQTLTKLQDARRAGDITKASPAYDVLVDELAAERTETASAMVSGSGGRSSQVQKARKATDEALAAVRASLAGVSVAELKGEAALGLKQSQQGHARLK